MDEENTVADALKGLRVRSGMPVRELAAKAKFQSTNAYTHYETRFKRSLLPYEIAQQIAEAIAGKGHPPIDRMEVMALAAPDIIVGSPPYRPPSLGLDEVPANARFAPDIRYPPPKATLRRGTPVYGTARGGTDGAFLLNRISDPVDWVRTPETLESTKDAFAVYVEGDSMEPWKVEGQILFINPHRKPRPGDHVIVVFGGVETGKEPQAMVKKLVRRSASYVELEQYNPRKTFQIPADQVSEIFKVLEPEELFII